MSASAGLDTVWVLLAAFLVFFMQAGFGMLEAGLVRAKNAGNILMKNFLDFALGSAVFFLAGYAFMFGKGNGFIGLSGFGLGEGAVNPSSVPLEAFWLFQACFCGAAATIVAGGVAERIKFHAYLVYTVVVSALVYPIIGHWAWGGGWLAGLGFGDFAGSAVVHLTGGSIALVGTIYLGPRIGKFGPDGRPRALPGHNIPLAVLGVFLLWFGWFGFNPGSTLAVGDGKAMSLVALNTNLAACAGTVAAMLASWVLFGKPDLSMTMNGALAGLVAITAPCAYVAPWAAMVIGLVGRALAVFGVILLDRVHVDDPVGAVPVHAMNGVWGTLAVGVFGEKALGLARDGLLHGGGFAQLGVQALGLAAVATFAAASMAVLFFCIDRVVGLRVTKEEELRGLDVGEHGMECYAGFQVFVTQ